jgi:hypothetical protein
MNASQNTTGSPLIEFRNMVARFLAGHGFLQPEAQVERSSVYVEHAWEDGMTAVRCADNISSHWNRKENV